MALEKVVVDCTKGTEKTVELTKKEIKQREADEQAAEAAAKLDEDADSTESA